jgi:hypothetical protein
MLSAFVCAALDEMALAVWRSPRTLAADYFSAGAAITTSSSLCRVMHDFNETNDFAGISSVSAFEPPKSVAKESAKRRARQRVPLRDFVIPSKCARCGCARASVPPGCVSWLLTAPQAWSAMVVQVTVL